MTCRKSNGHRGTKILEGSSDNNIEVGASTNLHDLTKEQHELAQGKSRSCSTTRSPASQSVEPCSTTGWRGSRREGQGQQRVARNLANPGQGQDNLVVGKIAHPKIAPSVSQLLYGREFVQQATLLFSQSAQNGDTFQGLFVSQFTT